MTPKQYAKQIVDEDLAIEGDAQSMTLAQIMAPVREEFASSSMTEDELDTMVTTARSRRRNRPAGKK